MLTLLLTVPIFLAITWFAVHFRAVPAFEDALHRELVSLMARHDVAGLKLMPGHCVFELKRQAFNKGVAIRRFLAQPRFSGRKPLFIGDDVTDLPGFQAAVEADGAAYSVGTRMAGTTGMFASPADVRRWVAGLAEADPVRA